MREEVKQIKMQAATGEKLNFGSYVNLCPMNEKETSVHKMKSWVRKARVFRTNAKDNIQQDIKKFGMIA